MSRHQSPLRDRNFVLFYSGIVLSQVGVRGTLAINLYHVFLLTGSTVSVGLVGLAQVLALVVLAPLGGALADRLDRRRLVQVTQGLSLLVSASLAAVTFLDLVTPLLIYLAVLLNSAVATFDTPARTALIPGIVPRHQLVKAFALVNPAREVSAMAGPALGGLLVVLGGPGLMYAVDAVTYGLLVVVLVFVRVAPVLPEPDRPGIMRSIAGGIRFVRQRAIMWQLMGLDVLAVLFGAWRAVLPALAEDILQVGPSGYGWLAAAVPAGAVCGSWFVYRMIDRLHGGRLILWATAAYGLACIVLAQSPVFAMALAAGLAVGAADALSSTVRQSAIHSETPDEIRGRVSSLQQLAAHGGTSLGTANIGLLAGLLGPVGALTAGALVPIAAAVGVGALSREVRDYRLPAARG